MPPGLALGSLRSERNKTKFGGRAPVRLPYVFTQGGSAEGASELTLNQAAVICLVISAQSLSSRKWGGLKGESTDQQRLGSRPRFPDAFARAGFARE